MKSIIKNRSKLIQTNLFTSESEQDLATSGYQSELNRIQELNRCALQYEAYVPGIRRSLKLQNNA